MVRKVWWAGVATVALLASATGVFWGTENLPWRLWCAQYDAQPNATPVAIDARPLTSARTNQPELCPTCHVGIEDISPSHAAEAIGCVVCHGGEPLAADADAAHSTLRGGRNPSDPSVAAVSCGQDGCHGGYAQAERNHVDRVLNSLMSTYAGGIALVRYAFGAQPSLAARFAVLGRQDHSVPLPAGALISLEKLSPASSSHPIDLRLQDDCLSGGCHLSSPPQQQPYFYRSTGCAACHYLYADDGLYCGGDPTIPRTEPGHGSVHRLTTAIPYTQCNHCHNRGNYSLKRLAFCTREDLPPVANTPANSLDEEARRLLECYQPLGDVTECEVELECVDCHTAGETMGDGHIYGSNESLLDVQCQTCHGTLTAPPSVSGVDDPALRQARANGRASFLLPSDKVVQTGRGEPMWSVKQLSATAFVQVGKATGKLYQVPLVLGSGCLQDGETQTSDHCHECHVAQR